MLTPPPLRHANVLNGWSLGVFATANLAQTMTKSSLSVLLIHRFLIIIGNSNVFEVDSTSYALKIGDFNNVESKSIVGKSTVLTNGCIIGAGCKIVTEEIIPENCVIYGSKNDRRQQGDRPGPQTLQIEYLSKVLPNYHHLKKPTKK